MSEPLLPVGAKAGSLSQELVALTGLASWRGRVWEVWGEQGLVSEKRHGCSGVDSLEEPSAHVFDLAVKHLTCM